MAAPITHIVLSDKIFNKHFSDFSKQEFFIGTSFPDIRYLGVIERHKTHFSNVSFQEIKQKNSFWAGLLFHSWVDEKEAEYMRLNNIYSLMPHLKHAGHSLKFFEDELLYDKLKDWNGMISFMEEILPEEENFGIEKKFVKKWHLMRQKYFSRKPNIETRKELLRNTIIPEQEIEEIEFNISVIRQEKKVCKIIENFYRDFDFLIFNGKINT